MLKAGEKREKKSSRQIKRIYYIYCGVLLEKRVPVSNPYSKSWRI